MVIFSKKLSKECSNLINDSEKVIRNRGIFITQSFT